MPKSSRLASPAPILTTKNFPLPSRISKKSSFLSTGLEEPWPKRFAAGCFGRPGISRIPPERTTISSAPVSAKTSFTLSVHPSGAPLSLGLSERDAGVFAIHIGRLPKPNFSIRSMSFITLSSNSTPEAPYNFRAMVWIFSLIGRFNSYNGLKREGSVSIISRAALAKSSAPLPPFVTASVASALTPNASQCSFIKATSSSVSPGNLLMTTRTGTPNFLIFSICLSRLANPFLSSERASPHFTLLLIISFSGTPPCTLRALTLATKITKAGLMPSSLATILKNFSAPNSVANPPSVTT